MERLTFFRLRIRKPSASIRLMILPKFPLRTESGLMIVNVRFDMSLLVLLRGIGRRIIAGGGWGAYALIQNQRQGAAIAAEEGSQGCERLLRATPGNEVHSFRAASAALENRDASSFDDPVPLTRHGSIDIPTRGARKKRSHPCLPSL